MYATADESVFFFTFHKCASTLFGSHILKQIDGLTHVDYASLIYEGGLDKEIVFEKQGFAYGPIRLSVNPLSPVNTRFVEPVSKPDFIRNKLALFFIRDPRDILISSYYSFGFSHGFSSVDEIREIQANRRNQIQPSSLDEYVLSAADDTLRNFERLDQLRRICKRGVTLKYENLIDDFEGFIRQMTRVVSLDPKVVMEIFQRSRPVAQENATMHRRSGKVGGFRDKLKKESIDCLNKKLKTVLEEFNYKT